MSEQWDIKEVLTWELEDHIREVIEQQLWQTTKLQAQLKAVRGLQRYDSESFGHTKSSIRYFKSETGGIILYKDIKATIGESDES